MENILVVGANTRAVACSLKKLGYTVYSADYFGVMDLRPCADIVRSVLDQKPAKSCGKFSERFDSHIVEEMALEMVDDVDGIICCAGVTPDKFPSHKIIGNHDIRIAEDKYRFFKKLKGYFNLPDTFLPGDIYEVSEIVRNSPEKQFILKPRSGSGGYGVFTLDSRSLKHKEELIFDILEEGRWVLQEFIDGETISASVLSTRDDAQTILTNSQIIGDESLGQREPFVYCGNIVPYNGDILISEIAQNVVGHLSLIGSIGVDFIIRNDEIYVIEVNPRLQGTFECAEMAMGVNMAELHLEACHGHIMPVPIPERFAVKMVMYAQERSQVGSLDIGDLYDLPNQGVIIEKGEPLATVLTASTIKEDAIYTAEKIVQRVYGSVKPLI